MDKLELKTIDQLTKECEEELQRRLRDGWGTKATGIWHYRPKVQTLELEHPHCWYEVDVERMTTSAACLDWIFQVNNKTWASPEIMKALLEAIDDLVRPQARLCSFGQERKRNR